jgi:hypothetical protein
VTTRARTVLAASLLGVLAAAGCTPPAGGFSPEDAATAIAATVAAMAAPTDTPAPAATAEEHALPTDPPADLPTAAAAELVLAFTDGGNVALLAGAGPSVPLTFSGSVEQVRLSDDGLKVAYTRRPVIDQPVELRVVNRDGTGDTLLMGPADFDALYPLGGAVHHDVYLFDFLPDNHVLLINTRSIFEGPGLAKHDDLIRIDTDSLARTMLLAPGKGGDFTASPDGRFLALVRPDTVELVHADGTPTGSGVISYTPVITYSEYAYYAQPVWNPASSMIGVAIPSPDPFAPATTGSIWQLPVGSPGSLLSTISGQFFLVSGDGPLVPPSLTHVAYTRPTSTPNVWNLYRASVDGSGEALVGIHSGWMGWSPDGAHFVYSTADPTSLLLGDLAGGSTPLVTGTDLRWYTAEAFVFLSGSPGAWTVQRGAIGSAPTPLAAPAGDFIDYAFAYR